MPGQALVADALQSDQASSSSPRVNFRCIRIHWNLRIEPPGFEQRFWRRTQTLRVLQLADTLAFIVVLVHVVSSFRNLLSIRVHDTAAPPPPAPLVFYTVSNLAYVITAALPLHLLAFRQTVYKTHRDKLVAVSRLLRAYTSTAVLLSSTAATAIASGLAARTAILRHRPGVALLLNTLQPGVFFVHQVVFFVPFRWAALLQSVAFGASLMWTARLPCLLSMHTAGSTAAVCSPPSIAAPGPSICLSPVAADSLNSSTVQAKQTGLCFQEQATDACLSMHYLTDLFSSMFGIVPVYKTTATGTAALLDTRGPPFYCQGVYAVQTLQVFVSMLMFLVIPLSMIFWWEYTWKVNYLNSLNAVSARRINNFWGWLSAWFNRACSRTTPEQSTIGSTSSVVVVQPLQWEQQGSMIHVLGFCTLIFTLVAYTAWLLCTLIVTVLQNEDCLAML